MSKIKGEKRKDNFLQADKILDTNLKIHIGNRDGIKPEHVIYYGPTGESSWKKTLRHLKHMYDPSLSGAPPPINGDGFEEGEPVMRTRDDVIRIFDIYQNKLLQLQKKAESLGLEKKFAKDVAGSTTGSISVAGTSVADDCEKKLIDIRKEQNKLQKSYNELETSLVAQKNEYEKKIKELQENIKMLESTSPGTSNDNFKKKLEEFLNGLDGKIWDLVGDKPDTITDPMSILKKILEALEAKINDCLTIEQKIQQLMEIAEELRKKIEDRDNVSSLDDIIALFERLIDIVPTPEDTIELNGLRMQLNAIEQQRDKLQETVKRLRDALELIKKSREMSEKREEENRAGSEKEKADSEKEKADLNNSVVQLTDDIERLTNSNIVLKGELDTLHLNLQRAQGELNSQKAAHDASEKRHTDEKVEQEEKHQQSMHQISQRLIEFNSQLEEANVRAVECEEQLNRLIQELQLKDTELAEKIRELKSMKNENTKLTTDNERKKAEIASLKSTNEDIQKENAKLDEHFRTAGQQLKDHFDSQISKLMDQKRKEIEDILSQKAELINNLSGDFNGQIVKLTALNIKLKNQLIQLNTAYKQMQELSDDKYKLIEERNVTILELRNIIGTQTAEIGSLISTLAEKSTSDTDAKKKNDQLTKTIEQLKSTNVELEKELETIKNQPSVVDEDGFNNLQEKNERLIQKITGLLALNNGLEDKIQLFRTENQGLTKILMTIKNLFQDDDKPITEKITSLLEQSDSLKSELKNFRQKNDTLRSNLTEAEKSVSEEKKSSETGDINHRKQVEQRNNKIRELEERIADINKNLIECKEMNQKLEIEKKREQQNFEKKQKEFESLGKERDDERKDFVEVRNKMTGQRNENAQLLATIQQQTILLTTQENQISMMNVRIKELEEQLEEEDKLRNRLGECHKRIEETEETIRSLKSNQSSNFESRRRRKPIRKSLELRPPFNTSTRVNDQGEFATSTKNPDGRTSSTTALYKDAARNRNLDFMGQGGKKKKTLKRKKRKKRGTMKNVPK